MLEKKQTCGVPSHRNLSGRHAPSLHVNSEGEQRGGRGGRGGGHRSSSEPSRQWSTPSHTSFSSRQVPSRQLQGRQEEGLAIREGRVAGAQAKPVSALRQRAPLLVVALGAVGVAVALPLPPQAVSTRTPEFTRSAAFPDFTTVGLVGAVVAVLKPVADALQRDAPSPDESIHSFNAVDSLFKTCFSLFIKVLRIFSKARVCSEFRSMRHLGMPALNFQCPIKRTSLLQVATRMESSCPCCRRRIHSGGMPPSRPGVGRLLRPRRSRPRLRRRGSPSGRRTSARRR